MMSSKQITIRVSGETVSLEPVERYLNHLYQVINKQRNLFGNMHAQQQLPKSFSVVIDSNGHLRLNGLVDHVSSLFQTIRENFSCSKNREEFSCLQSFIDEQEKGESSSCLTPCDRKSYFAKL